MSTFRNIDVKAPHIQQLQTNIQLELAKHSYSSEDDPVMAEYIVVMLANQKTAEQITAEMNDLIGPEYNAAFTEWIWNATQQCLDEHDRGRAGAGSAEASTSAVGAAGTTNDFSARTRNTQQRRSRSPQRNAQPSRAREQRRSRSPMQANARRAEQRRSRSPPAATSAAAAAQRRADVRDRMPRDYSSYEAWQSSIKPRSGDEQPFDGASYWRKKAQDRRTNPPPPVHGGARETRIFNAALDQAVQNSLATYANESSNSNSNRELFPDDDPPPEYSASNGLSIFGRAGIPDPRAAEFVPSGSTANPSEPAAASSAAGVGGGTSIFARIDPMLPNNQPLASSATAETVPNHSSHFPTAPTETSICRWNVGCTNPVCPYSHASPANAGPHGDPNALVLSQQNCRYGARCTNKDCTRSHVSPAVARIQARQAAPVTFSSFTASAPTAAPVAATAPAAAVAAPATLSMDTALPSQASSRPCRFGAACTRADCFFSHPATRGLTNSSGAGGIGSGVPCRFGLGCTRADCYFEHPPGQRASGANGTADRLQVFAQQAADEDMEVILPGRAGGAAGEIQAGGGDGDGVKAEPVSLTT